MLATFADTKRGLGTAVLAADSPMGPFALWSNGYVTPKADRCLDGTLYLSRKARRIWYTVMSGGKSTTEPSARFACALT